MIARINGTVICGDSNGYYRPETRAEIRSYYKTVMARQKSTAQSIAACRRKLKELDNNDSEYIQMELELEESHG